MVDEHVAASDQVPPVAVRLGQYVAAPVTPPDSVVERARLAMLDLLGVMVGATGTVVGQRILSYTESRGGGGTTTTIGLASRRRAEDSALANGTLAHILEFDDGHRPSDNHLGCVVVPSALVLAEETGADLRACLEAIIVGYDVMGRAGEATLLPRNESPFHGTGTTGVFGSAAVAVRLLGLGAMQAAQAFAIAGTAAAGLRESTNRGPDCKPLHAGRAAQNGLTAGYLAKLGYTGPLTVFEGVFGFCGAMVSRPRPEMMLDRLGERFSLLETGFKVHSTCGTLFTILDGILENRAKYDLAQHVPTSIRIGAPSRIVEDPPFRRERPPTPSEARFSIPFAVAAGIVDGEVSLRQMTSVKLADPAIADVEVRVVVECDDEVEAIYQATKDDAFFYYPASIDFELDGQHFRTLHTNPRGYDPSIPLTRAEVITKFHSTVAGLVSQCNANELVNRILHGPLDGGVGPITELIGALA